MPLPRKRSPRKKGRKFRNLTNGRLYHTKGGSKAALESSKRMKENLDCSNMMKAVEASHTPAALAKRAASMRRFLKAHPNWQSERVKKSWQDHPELRELKRKMIEDIRHLIGSPLTDNEAAEKVAHMLRTCRNGREVVRYVKCQREKTVGVVQEDSE